MRHGILAICTMCLKERKIVADLSILALVGHATKDGSWAQHQVRFNHPLCGHCFRGAGNGGNPGVQVNLSSGGFVKRLTYKQEEARRFARKRAEKKALQEELEWEPEPFV